MRSLLLRLLAASALVSIVAVTATTWLAVRTTSRALQQEQAQLLTEDAKVYDALLGWAAVHHDWSGAAPLVRTLAARSGHRIALTTRDRQPLLDSAGGDLPARASATVDPLQDLTAGIDPRVVGPFALTAAERTEWHVRAAAVLTCVQKTPADSVPAPVAAQEERIVRDARIVTLPGGRPTVDTPGADASGDLACLRPRAWLAEPAPTERHALARLDALVSECLAPRNIPAVTVTLNWSWRWADPASVRAGRGQDAVVERCLAAARRELLTPYVAPPALLFLTTPGQPASTGIDLSHASRVRIAAVSTLVLLVTLLAGALVAGRLTRPLRELTTAAQRMRDGDGTARVRVTGGDEIARLGAVFNDMAARRQEVEQLRRDMVGDIAHEMRTPVTNIRGWLEAAEDGVVVLDRTLAASLLEEALLLQHVLDDLRDLSAADAGELRLHPGPVDLPELLSQVATAYRTAAVAVVVDVEVAAPLMLTADPIRLRQAVGNLTANAVRHSPPGATVTLRAFPSGGEVVIDVIDQGPGLSAEELPLVFERFWRAEKSRSRQTGGSGLGLAITRKLVEAHGGRVSAASVPGHGATFTLRLPA